MKKLFVKIINGLSKIKLLSFEKVTIAYIFITTIIIFINYKELPHPNSLLFFRAGFTTLIFLLSILSVFNKKIFVFLRYTLIGISLIYWYPETFEINRIFSNLDFKIALLEQTIFGFQPALQFQIAFPNHILNEVFHFGYFSYYPIIVGVGLYVLLIDKKIIEKYVFSVIFSFFTYYLIFSLFPTAGPQYYFPAIGLENVRAGNFPDILHYFNHNVKLQVVENGSGLFYKLVELSQQLGERPTAAFPSSHVGITTIIILFLLKHRHYAATLIIFPIYALLVASTVYIQAHYAVDVFAGIFTAIIFSIISNGIYPLFSYRFEMNQFLLNKLPAFIENLN